MKKIVLLVLMMSTLVFSQVNIENVRLSQSSDDNPLLHQLEGSLDLSYGNEDLSLFAGKWRTDYVVDGWHSFVIGRFEYGVRDNVEISDQSFFHLRTNFDYRNQFSWEGFTQYESHEFLSLKRRVLIGGGARVLVSQFDKGTVYMGLGLMWEEEQTTGENLKKIRSTNYLSYKYPISETIRVDGTMYYQFVVDDINDYRILLESQIHFDINDNMALNMGLDYRYFSSPELGLGTTDLSINNGIEFRF